MRSIWITAIGLTMSFASVVAPAQSVEVPLRVSLCEIKAHPEKYLRKLVEFRAIASHGFEDSMVDDDRCPWPDNHPGIWMEYGGLRSTNTMYCCGISPKATRDKPPVIDGISLPLIEDENFRVFDAHLHPHHSKPPQASDTIHATLRGRIFGGYENLDGTEQHRFWGGYGHMGCCMLFVVTQVVSIDSPK